MKSSSINYTPLNDSYSPKPKMNFKTFIALNILAVIVGVGITFVYYVNLQIASNSQTTSTQASELKTICEENPLSNPETVKASINNGEQEIMIGEIVNTNVVTFEWEPINGAELYYIYLHESARKSNEIVDPATLGISTNVPTYTFENLEPNQTYYLYVRTKGLDDTLGMTFPTPGNCDIFIPAKPIFYFKTETS